MPAFESAVWEMNRGLGPDAIASISAEAFAPGNTLADGMRRLGVSNDRAIEFTRSFPQSLQEALRAVLHDVLSRDSRPPITVTFKPSYDFEVRIWEPIGTKDSRGGVYIEVRGRYPFDTHPSTAYDQAT